MLVTSELVADNVSRIDAAAVAVDTNPNTMIAVDKFNNITQL